jgi:hypothetical protein
VDFDIFHGIAEGYSGLVAYLEKLLSYCLLSQRGPLIQQLVNLLVTFFLISIAVI